MGDFMSVNPNFVQAIKDSFAKQGLMSHIGARLGAIRPGYVEIGLPYSEAVSQQHGFFHGGVVAAIGDSASGYAAFSLMDAGDGVLTVEYKVNLLAPADGEKLIASGQVIRSGRTLTVARSEVVVIKDDQATLCGCLQQTLMRIVGRPEVRG